jgi:hypothetical protein
MGQLTIVGTRFSASLAHTAHSAIALRFAAHGRQGPPISSAHPAMGRAAVGENSNSLMQATEKPDQQNDRNWDAD